MASSKEVTAQKRITSKEIMDALVPHSFDLASALKIEQDIDLMIRDGVLTQEFALKLMDSCKGNKVPPILMERIIENSRGLFGDPRFDFSDYVDLTVKLHRQFGAGVAGYFSLSYGGIISQEINPQVYFSWTERAVREGGKKFASFYVYCLPKVLKTGGNADEFRESAADLNKIGGMKIVKPFILNSATALEAGIPVLQFRDLSIQATTDLGKDTAYWVVRNMADLAVLGFEPQRLLEETKALFAEKGEKAANWYASGFTELLLLKREIKRKMREMEHLQEEHPLDLSWSSAVFRYKNLDKYFNPLDFRDGYILLLITLGQAAATFYSLATKSSTNSKFSNGWYREEEIKSFQELPDNIIDFQGKVSKRVYNRALWYVIKLSNIPSEIKELFNAIAEATELYSDQEIIEALRLTYGDKKVSRFSFSPYSQFTFTLRALKVEDEEIFEME